MAWEICIAAEGWQEIRDKLDEWSPEALIDAIADDKFELVFAKAGMEHAERAANAERERLAGLAHDILADRAFELVQSNRTCDNGGFTYWIRQGGLSQSPSRSVADTLQGSTHNPQRRRICSSRRTKSMTLPHLRSGT